MSGAWIGRYQCHTCKGWYHDRFRHPTLGWVCPICLCPPFGEPPSQPTTAKPKTKKKPAKKRPQPVLEARVGVSGVWQRKVILLLQRDGGDCWLCGCSLGLDITLDHVTPKAHGGSNGIDNLRLAHWACNNKRGCTPPPDAQAHV